MADPSLHSYAQVYNVLRQLMSPAEADRCEIWQLGAVLGLHEEAEEKAEPESNVVPIRPGPVAPKADPSFAERAKAWLSTGEDPAMKGVSSGDN